MQRRVVREDTFANNEPEIVENILPGAVKNNEPEVVKSNDPVTEVPLEQKSEESPFLPDTEKVYMYDPYSKRQYASKNPP